MKSLDQGREKRCRWFNGLVHEACKAGIPYAAVTQYATSQGPTGPVKTKSLPCLGECDGCSAYMPKTPEELAADRAAVLESMERVAAGRSPCCNAELNCSQVIPSGRHAGHGPRYCSKCGKLAFMV